MTIDDDVLAAAKGLAALEHKTVGEVISSLARKSLRSQQTSVQTRNGVPLLPIQPNARAATLELVNQLRDELP